MIDTMMDISDIWDWNFFWSMWKNFMKTGSNFVMVVVAVVVVGMLMAAIVNAVKGRKT
ncbi:PTS ascorbate transporter subunit IIC (plasmid) [Paenibacillus polymyxa]|uniref:PTS ascorbate transporter subunit IIC n=2 Tax=Paenibacillus TaxID=44249 RepID=UPI0020254259|nr:PTS ascorbate transporter subunit IIC [Paenibacillus polymyxa]URJ38186.3 PTS ascorbate transporter subunit IIC [Paenibacillus polymyxa]